MQTRTNREIRNDFTKKIKYSDEYKIEIVKLYINDVLELTVFLDIDGESSSDYECIMTEQNENPSKEMLKKAKAEYKYFKQHFENVELKDEIVYA